VEEPRLSLCFEELCLSAGYPASRARGSRQCFRLVPATLRRAQAMESMVLETVFAEAPSSALCFTRLCTHAHSMPSIVHRVRDALTRLQKLLSIIIFPRQGFIALLCMASCVKSSLKQSKGLGLFFRAHLSLARSLSLSCSLCSACLLFEIKTILVTWCRLLYRACCFLK
jgi:hypothetical protein